MSCPIESLPDIEEKAPIIPTAVYTRLFTNLVHGLVKEEKNVAFKEHFSS